MPGALTKSSGLLNLSQDELANNVDLVQTNGQVSSDMQLYFICLQNTFDFYSYTVYVYALRMAHSLSLK